MHGIEPRKDWFLTRSGYTGEDGFEIGLPQADARALVAKLLQDERVQWIGLAARDSLRLEAGLCLHGQDISTDTNPVDAGLMWAIPKDIRASGAFVGADALRAAITQGPARKRVGLKPEGRQPVRAGTPLFDADGNMAGTVTSAASVPPPATPSPWATCRAPLPRPARRFSPTCAEQKFPFPSTLCPSRHTAIAKDEFDAQDLLHRRPRMAFR